MIQVLFADTDGFDAGDIASFERAYKNIADATVTELKLGGDAEVEISFFSEEEICELNARTRNIDKVTDVLSYPALEEIKEFSKQNYPFDTDDETGRVFLGSIVICTKRASEQAQEYGHSLQREMTYLFVHGLLHLLGYDHIDEDDKKLMRKYEELILSRAENL